MAEASRGDAREPGFIIGPTKKVDKETRRQQIIRALSSEDLSTSQLARGSAFHSSTLRRDCHDLQEEGRVSSYQQEYVVLFFPMTGEVLHRNNYSRLQELNRQLEATLEQHPPGTAGLAAALRKYFRGLLDRRDLARFEGRIRDFERRLLAALPSAEKKKDLQEFLGFKRMPRQRLIWTQP